MSYRLKNLRYVKIHANCLKCHIISWINTRSSLKYYEKLFGFLNVCTKMDTMESSCYYSFIFIVNDVSISPTTKNPILS